MTRQAMRRKSAVKMARWTRTFLATPTSRAKKWRLKAWHDIRQQEKPSMFRRAKLWAFGR